MIDSVEQWGTKVSYAVAVGLIRSCRTVAVVSRSGLLALALAGVSFAGDAKVGSDVQGHVAAEHRQAVKAPVPVSGNNQAYADERWWAPSDGRPFAAALTFPNEQGAVTTLNSAGITETGAHAFFTPLGSNGRACVTCHQPADAMSISAATVQRRWQATGGKDPLFAAVDGSNCPNLPQDDRASHSLLLERGLFRVFRPWPPKAANGSTLETEFTIEVVRDPTGCNTNPVYGLHSTTPMVSVYRRPRPVTNVKFLTAMGFAIEPKNGLPLQLDPETGVPTSGNLMADARDLTLKTQAIEAAMTHLQAASKPAPEAIAQILEFERQLHTAQSHDRWGSSLTDAGASGGPGALAVANAGYLQSGGEPIWSEFASWKQLPAGADPRAEEQRNFRESVARGAKVFAQKTFLIWDSAGITNMGFGNPVRNSCSFCHNMTHTGMDVAPGQVDLGTTNEPFAKPAADLPLFKLTCRPESKPHPHLGRVVYTQDPGFALTTGRCRDIGKITMQQMRGLSARAPYFVNGSAQTLREIIDFYDQRYNIRYSEQEKQDLTNLLSVL